MIPTTATVNVVQSPSTTEGGLASKDWIVGGGGLVGVAVGGSGVPVGGTLVAVAGTLVAVGGAVGDAATVGTWLGVGVAVSTGAGGAGGGGEGLGSSPVTLTVTGTAFIISPLEAKVRHCSM
jgi:hypothetical protein